MIHRALTGLVLLSAACGAAASRPLVELKGTIQAFDSQSFGLSATLAGLLTDVHGRPCDVTIGLRRENGAWTNPSARSELWRDVRAALDVGELTLAGGKLGGPIRLTVAGRSRKVAALTCRISARIVADLSKLPPAQASAARSASAVRGILGTAEPPAAQGAKGGARRCVLAGHLTLPRRPGFFDRGRYEGGLALNLDMGSRRVNWNHQRSAVYTFGEPRDLSEFTHLRVKVRTARPRDDAAVTVWLGEADGSWYYLKDAVPLVDAENEAVVAFDDFVMAEWVCPGSHLDEDLALDLKRIGAFAVGVVNPLGVGRVAFTVTGIDLVRRDRPARPAVRLAVTGRTLSVNGHNLVPAGIFGGYAPDLPAAYRPGCQRALYAPSYPIVPRQRWVQFGAASLADWRAVWTALKGGDSSRPALSKHLAGLLDEAQKTSLSRVRPEKVRPGQAPRELTDCLNALLRRRDLYAAAAFEAVKLDETLRRRAARDARAALNDTELMELNRRLLEAAFPKAVRPAPRDAPSELFWVNCYGERKEPAHFFRADWREHLAAWGRTFAANARRAGCPVVFEFWNEPYLNWAERSWVHYRPELYKVSQAVDGGPVAVARKSAFCRGHVRDWRRLAGIFRQGAAAEDSLEGLLHDALDRRARQALAELPAGEEPDRRLADRLLRALNEQLSVRRRGRDGRPRAAGLYNERRFAGVKLPREIADLLPILKAEKIDPSKLARLNRGLLSAAWPGLFAPDPAAAPDEIIPHFRWKKIPTGWRVVDETAFTYWSGKGNGYIYDSMLAVIGKAVKETNPDVKVFGGWGFRWNEDHWGAWRVLYKDTIDRTIRWIDGIHEHHYQGDPTAMHGTYEVAAAYGVTRHGKWLYSINTETNDLLDSPARGRLDTPEKVRRSTEYRRMVYNLRDCIYAVAQSPDKLYGRTVIHHARMPEATRVAYGMMKNLRGRLIETSSADPRVWVVASVDGTDPASMPRPDEPPRALVVFVLNGDNEPRRAALDIRAPDGTDFAGGTVQHNTVDAETFAIDLKTAPARAAGQTLHFDLSLQAGLAWKITLPLARPIVAADQVRRKQFFSADILQRIRRSKPWSTTVRLDAAALKAAKRAALRLVLEDVARGEGRVSVNGQVLALPAACTQDNVNRIVELPLEPAALTAETKVVYTVRPGNHAGYQVDMTSIVLESRAE